MSMYIHLLTVTRTPRLLRIAITDDNILCITHDNMGAMHEVIIIKSKECH